MRRTSKEIHELIMKAFEENEILTMKRLHKITGIAISTLNAALAREPTICEDDDNRLMIAVYD